MQIHQIGNPEESFYILNIYNEKSHHLIVPTLTTQRLFQLDINWDRPFLLLGDLNLHHLSWNPAINSPTRNAEIFANYMEINQAILLNDFTIIEEFGGTFCRSNTQKTSIIDLTYVSGFQRLQWQNWKYCECTGSDHEVISFETSINPSIHNSGENQPSNFNLKKANWDLFGNNLAALESKANSELDQLISTRNFDGIAILLKTIVHQAATNAIPRIRTSPRSKSWWKNELTNLRKKYHYLRRLAKKTLDPGIKEEAQRIRNQYFRSISEHKAQHWEAFLEQAQGKTAYTAFQYSNTSHQQSPVIPTLK